MLLWMVNRLQSFWSKNSRTPWTADYQHKRIWKSEDYREKDSLRKVGLYILHNFETFFLQSFIMRACQDDLLLPWVIKIAVKSTTNEPDEMVTNSKSNLHTYTPWCSASATQDNARRCACRWVYTWTFTAHSARFITTVRRAAPCGAGRDVSERDLMKRIATKLHQFRRSSSSLRDVVVAVF